MVTLNRIEYKEIIVCLFDGSFNLGFAALANSLMGSNFSGLIYVGYRGSLPEWTKQLKSIDANSFYLTSEVVIKFVPVSTELHLGYYKPYFLRETFDAFPFTNKIYYFDTDIVVKAPWNVISKWLDECVCLCLDSNFHYVHTNHPWRKDWRQLAGGKYQAYNNTDQYFNSGFLAIHRNCIALLHRWIYFTDRYIKVGGDTGQFTRDENSSFKSDQDLLNAAITVSPDIEISVMGREGMGFALPATIMLHAIGEIKPWNKRFLKELFRTGNAPNNAEKMFFGFCNHPISIFTKFNYNIKRFDLLAASFLGRFLG